MRSSETRTESQRSLNGRYVAATLILLILGVEGAFYHLGGWNQYARVSAAVAFVEPGTPYTGTFRIDGLKDDGARLATGDWALARSGFYSNKAPGVSFLAVVPYFLLYHAERLAGLDPKTGWLTHINVWALNLWISGFWNIVAALALLRKLPRFGVHSREGAALVAVVYSCVLTTVIALAIKYTMGLRLDEEDEVNGIDLVAHGETAYDLHSGTGGGSSSVLAASTAPVATTTKTEGASA